MLSNLSNNNSGNTTKSVVEKKKYEDIEKRLDEMQDEIEMTEQGVSTNSQAISDLNDRVDAVEDNSTFPELNTDTINPATGDKVEITSDLDVDGEVEANSVKTNSLSVNGTSFETVKDNAAQAKAIALDAESRADGAYDLADAVADELADYKADNEQSITTGTLNADSVVTDSITAQTINTNDFETTNAEIDKLYVDIIKATGFLELPTVGQSYYTITVPAKTTASFSGIYTSDNNTDYPFYFTVSDGAVVYKQGSTEIIKDISFDRETGYTKVRVKSSTNLTYISSALDSNPVTIEDGGEAYADYAFIPQKTGGYLIRGYDDTTTEIYIAGVLKAYAMSVEEEIIERTSVDFLKVNASIELPQDWDAGGTISYSTGEENQYISAQTKAGVTKPTWTSPIHSTIGSLSYSSKLVDEATVASYKGISETRQTQTISITNEASLQQLTTFHWTKNGNYWQPYELTRVTIGDQTMWIDPTEANQGIRFYNNQVIADGTWNDVPVEEANAVPVNLVIFDAPTELSFPITNLGDKTTVHGEITATCFKGNVLGNVTGNADTATNSTCFDSKTYAEAKADILSGCAADSNMFNGKTYSEAKTDILSGNAASATNATCFDGKTYSQAKADILSGCAASADNATCFNGKTYAEAKADILSGTSAQAHCVDIDSLTTNSYPLVMESTTCELGKSGTCQITFTPSTGILETNQASTSCIENSGTIKSQCLCATSDINVDGNAYITGDLTVQGTITTTHSEEVVTPSENIILRDGATTPIASGCYSGFTVTNYDGQDNNLEVGADKDGTLHVGVVGGTMEPIATRATESCMEDGYAAHWDSTGTDLVTKGATSTHDLTVNGNASVSGTLTADLTGTADNATCFNNKTYSEACADILSGCASNADNATKFDGKTYTEAKTDILSGCAADSAKLGNKDASSYIDTSSTAQTKAGNLCIGAPAACTSTSAGGNGLIMNSLGTIALYKEGTPYIDFHYDKYCGGYSSRICSSHTSSNNRGSLDITVNNGTGRTVCDECATYCFKSDGTFTGASKICASTNIYSAGCPVVTTGTLPTVAPGYNCTGTSNYVVTTMVCCAKTVCRNQATTGTCHLALFSDKTADANADAYVSSACELTYEPATGVLTTASDVQARNTVRRGEYYNIASANVGKYVLLAQASYAYNGNHDVSISGYLTRGNAISNRFTLVARASGTAVQSSSLLLLQKTNDIKGTYDFDATSHTITIRLYGKLTAQYQRTKIAIDNFTKGDVYPFVSTYDSALTLPMTVSSTMTGTEITTTYMDVESANTVNISTSSSNAEYPLVFSTCCATPAAGNRTLYNDSANNLMYNPSTNTLTTNCVRGLNRVIVGCPTGCTSTQSGIGGAELAGGIDLYHGTPFIDFHHNNACADFSHRIISGTGQLRIVATNATGCTAATQQSEFDFCSDGIMCVPNALCVGIDCGRYTGRNAELFGPTPYIDFHFNNYCGDYSTRFINIAQGTTQLIVNNGTGTTTSSESATYDFKSDGTLKAACFDGNATCFGGCTYAEACADIAGSVETTPYTCINDVNAGAQDILMTSSTGTLGIVNASTGTNACPLKYNPATGVLTACSFIVCSDKSLAVVSKDGTALGKGATAVIHDVYVGTTAIGYESLACCASTAIGGHANATAVGGIAIGESCSCGNFGIAIGEGADTFADNGIALGCGSRAACRNAIAIGSTACACNTRAIAIGYYACANNCGDLAIGHNALTGTRFDGFVIFKDIRYNGFRETTFCIADSATQNSVYLELDSMFCSNPAEGCPGYGHSTWPAYGIRGLNGCFYGGACKGNWSTGCGFWNIGGLSFTRGCTATVNENVFVTVIAPVKS